MQSLERAAVVLRAVAAAGPRGARLADVSDASGLSRSTAHRFLLALAAAGFLEQGPGDGAFYLGLELCSLGAAAANRTSCGMWHGPSCIDSPRRAAIPSTCRW